MKCNPKINGTTRWRPGKCLIPVDCQLCCVVREEHIESFGTILLFASLRRSAMNMSLATRILTKKKHFLTFKMCVHTATTLY